MIRPAVEADVPELVAMIRAIPGIDQGNSIRRFGTSAEKERSRCAVFPFNKLSLLLSFRPLHPLQHCVRLLAKHEIIWITGHQALERCAGFVSADLLQYFQATCLAQRVSG